MIPLLEKVCSDYLTGDDNVPAYLEKFTEVKFLGLPIYRKVINSTNLKQIAEYGTKETKSIGF